MTVIWFTALGAFTLYLIQYAMKWQKSNFNLPWYSWGLAILSYLTFAVSVPLVYTMAGEAIKRPAFITALIAGIILVAFIALTRQSVIMFQKKQQQVDKQETVEA